MTTAGDRDSIGSRDAKELFPMHAYTFIALDIARERAAEADRHRQAALARRGAPARPSWPRRGLAHGFAFVSRTSAAIARRLDGCIADDLGRSLSPSE